MRVFCFIGNIFWFLGGGFIVGLEYICGGILLCITIIGIPFGIQLFKSLPLVCFPFGRKIVETEKNGSCLNILMNFIWIIFGGLIAALTHLFLGVFWLITIIGIPIGLQHFKLMKISLLPFGHKIEKC